MVGAESLGRIHKVKPPFGTDGPVLFFAIEKVAFVKEPHGADKFTAGKHAGAADEIKLFFHHVPF